jgi:hypothetical protein
MGPSDRTPTIPIRFTATGPAPDRLMVDHSFQGMFHRSAR